MSVFDLATGGGAVLGLIGAVGGAIRYVLLERAAAQESEAVYARLRAETMDWGKPWYECDRPAPRPEPDAWDQIVGIPMDDWQRADTNEQVGWLAWLRDHPMSVPNQTDLAAWNGDAVLTESFDGWQVVDDWWTPPEGGTPIRVRRRVA